MAVLNQVRIMNGLDYVHGDLLPRNLVFSADNGYVIDFDLTRKVGGRYVSKYNHVDPYRVWQALNPLPAYLVVELPTFRLVREPTGWRSGSSDR